MRELKPIWDGGDPDSITLELVQSEEDAASGITPEKFFLRLDDSLRDFLRENFNLVPASATSQTASSAASAGEAGDAGHVGVDKRAAADGTDDHSAAGETDDSSVRTEDRAPAANTEAAKAGGADSAEDASAADEAAAPAPAKPAFEEPKVVLSPREIQDRIRAGKSVDELVEYSGMQRRKIEAFAYPVLAERARIAELGKLSRARRQDGPTKLTLSEILAAAFAARGLEVADATWDAYRNGVGQWIITLTWSAGHSTNTAEWSYQAEGAQGMSIARNDLAAELVDPGWARRHRDLAPASSEDEPPLAGEDADDALPPTWQSGASGSRRNSARAAADGQADNPAHVASSVADGDEEDQEAHFLQDPEPPQPPRRRKKTVMPSWEDVLFGVRPQDRNK